MNTDIFDSLFKQALGLHNYTDRSYRNSSSTFPPYNVLVDNKENPTFYTVEVAVAGFSKDQLSVKLRKDTGIPILTIEGTKTGTDIGIYAVKGMAARSFSREFTLANNIKVHDVNLSDGILTIKLETVKQNDEETVLLIN